jgi:hypothetical protein
MENPALPGDEPLSGIPGGELIIMDDRETGR